MEDFDMNEDPWNVSRKSPGSVNQGFSSDSEFPSQDAVVVQAEVLSTDEPIIEDEPITQDEVITQDDVVTQDEVITQDDVVTQNEPITQDEPITQSEPVIESVPENTDEEISYSVIDFPTEEETKSVAVNLSKDSGRENHELSLVKAEQSSSENPDKNLFKVFSIVSMSLGILSIIAGFLPCGLIALVFGLISIKNDEKNGFATAGIVCSLVSIFMTILLFGVIFNAFTSIFSLLNKF